MLRLLADENFNNDLLRGMLRRNPKLDVVRVQDAGLSGASDPIILEWAASNSRILLTHDVSTITKYAYKRIEAGQSMPGVFEVNPAAPFAQIIEDLLLLASASLEGEWNHMILYIPLR